MEDKQKKREQRESHDLNIERISEVLKDEEHTNMIDGLEE